MALLLLVVHRHPFSRMCHHHKLALSTSQVHTLDRFTRERAVVGFALLPVFLDPREGGQPASRSLRDYVLNQVRPRQFKCKNYTNLPSWFEASFLCVA